MSKEDTKKLIEAIEKLTKELEKVNNKPIPYLPPVYIPYPVPQPYPVYPQPYQPYYQPLPLTPYWSTMGIGVSNSNLVCNNSVDTTASYQ